MHPRLHFTLFLIISFAVHALAVMALFVHRPSLPENLLITPVEIVNLPPQDSKQLPPLDRPAPVQPPVPERFIQEKPLSPDAVPKPDKFGIDEEIMLPKTSPPRIGVPEGAEHGKEKGKTGSQPYHEFDLLPFLSQSDIDELARKGMPAKKPGDDSITLDTDEFKFISYNRWLKIKVESVLHYPELAAISGYQGTLYVLFDIMKDGSLGRLEILKPSGYRILDDEALRSIRAAAPFQPLPKEWNMDRYPIRAAVLFYLGTGYIR